MVAALPQKSNPNPNTAITMATITAMPEPIAIIVSLLRP